MDENNREYKNDDITVFWKPSKCIHSAVCFTKLSEVFDPARRPWINMKGASTEKIIDIVNQCPTDALTYKWNDESKKKETSSKKATKNVQQDSLAALTKIQILKDGPILVEGKFKVIGIHGTEIQTASIVSFCRCGNSKNMPFCDGTHRKTGFKE